MASTSNLTAHGSTTIFSQPPDTNAGGKVKQRRQRQRLSCVECTKRRQKCDRQVPCGLCTTRGIPNLCRWEPMVARPTPQRPPAIVTANAADATIETLSARIATLEKALLEQSRQDTQNEWNKASSVSSGLSPESSADSSAESPPSDNCGGPETTVNAANSASNGEDGPRALLDFDVQVAAVALAQLSLAPRTEYIGAGSVICALHKLGDPDSWRFPYAMSSLTSPVNTATGSNGNSHPLVSPIRELVKKLPPRQHLEELLTSFFTERNWQYSISERWFRALCQKMWMHLEIRCTPSCRTQDGGCEACKEEINPHWLSLLFSVLALAPASGKAAKNSAGYFMAALTAKRLVEDILLASPVYSTSEGAVHGGVLGCIAAVFQAAYLGDRGRVSEAWKLIGSALRSAQAMGMHRDPGWQKWEAMHKVECELRVLGWWLLMISDRIYSFILGRPAMAPKGTYDVRALPPDTHGDGSANPCSLFQRAFIALSEIIADACDECLSVHTPPYATVLKADRRFQAWEAKLPAYLRWRTPSASVFDDPSQERPPAICEKDLQYQRHTLAAWYLNGLMNIHRPYLMHSPPILPPPGTAAGPRTRIMLNPSRKRCIEAALELTRVLCNFHDEAAAWTEPGGLNPGMAAYFVFDGAVALAGALSQTPPHPQSQECLGLMNKAMRVLQELADSSQSIDGEGEMAKRGITILMALRRAGGWDMNDAEKGELVLLQDILEAQQQQEQATQNGTPGNQSNNPLASASVGMDIFHDISLLNHPVSNSATYGPQPTATETLSTSSFIPYLSSPQFSRASPYMSTSGQDNTSFSNLFSDMDIPFTASLGVSTSRLTQSMLMPFDVLQGVQPDSQGIGEFDLDWAKLAGMQSWYNNGAVPIDGSAGP